MKKGLLSVAFFSVIWLLIGACTPALKETRPGEIADPYYRPKRVYALDFNQAWDLTLKAMNRQGISPQLSNEEMGVIQTDYENVSPWERNRCALRFSQEPQRKTFIHILCRREGRTEMNEPFRDLTYTSPLEAMKAEESLYRRIEPSLLPFERSPRAQQEMMARGELYPVAPPVTSAPINGKAARTVLLPQTEIVPLRPLAGSAPSEVSPSALHSMEAAPEPPSAAETKTTGFDGKTAIVYVSTVEAANARMAPSTQGKLVTVLKRGEKAERVGVSGMWTKVKLFTGEIVWVHSDFVQEVNGGKGIAGIFSVDKERNGGYPPPASKNPAAAEGRVPPASPVKPETPKKGMAEPSKMNLETKAITNMRAEPSSTSKVVLVLKKGRGVEKIGESGDFSKVKLSWGDTGWVVTRSLKDR